jgi:hypothetical protein
MGDGSRTVARPGIGMFYVAGAAILFASKGLFS